MVLLEFNDNLHWYNSLLSLLFAFQMHTGSLHANASDGLDLVKFCHAPQNGMHEN